MSELLKFQNDPYACAADYLSELRKADGIWDEGIDIDSALTVMQESFDRGDIDLHVLARIRQKVPSTYLAPVVSKLITEKKTILPISWRKSVVEKEIVRTFLREAAELNLGELRAFEIRASAGGEVQEDPLTPILLNFKRNLEFIGSPSSGEKK